MTINTDVVYDSVWQPYPNDQICTDIRYWGPFSNSYVHNLPCGHPGLVKFDVGDLVYIHCLANSDGTLQRRHGYLPSLEFLCDYNETTEWRRRYTNGIAYGRQWCTYGVVVTVGSWHAY